MLYVFIVSSGTMVKFDMNLAVKKVLELKTEISRCVHIPVEDQVLLCSGGEELKSDNIVGNYYGAGTDTNPIFLFSKYTSDSDLPFNIQLKTSIDLSIEDDVRGCASMTPSSGAATVRSALAQRFAEAAVNGRRECDELVHGQHLQQQGWAAVIANLEDAKDSLLKRKAHFEELFQKYLANRSFYRETIKTFPDDIELLAKVPLLPKLMLGNECIEEDLETEHTLLSWFCSEPRPVLESLAEKCQRSLDELDEHSLIALNEDIVSVLKNADNSDIKEVKGIEERLSLLNKQIEDAKKFEKDQRDLASWFSHTQGRISRDPLVLPDLCGTFQNQLELMLQNHKCLRDILERCTKAKMELSESINYRVKYICRVESEMYDLQVRIIFLEKHVHSVMKQIESFHQVHLAPQRYLKMLAEVCRRRTFSSIFMKWATELSAQAFKLYQKEISLRKSFSSEETKNMVDNLFPGMDDVPPPFAIECPRPFDQNLPNVVKRDLEMLKIRFPELSHFCCVPPPDPMPYTSQAESDSAFSSNIPSSRIVGDSADSGERAQHEKGQISPHKLAAPSGDYSSLPSEYASMPNEVFSLTSSPFEDPMLPNTDLELTKRTKMPPSQNSELSVSSTTKGILTEERMMTAESDGEEFETVERYGTSPVEISPQPSHNKRSISAPRPTSSSDVISVNKTHEDHCPKVSKARSDGDAISPIQERLKASDSLLVSTDFQATEYYIDDSMPSSYTESNATSPLLRGNRMVKSHHVVLAELQRQVEEKNGALIGATSSLKNSRCNILKLHAKISALQKFIQELQGSLQSDLSNLKTFVKEEFWERMSEVSQVIENINRIMADLQQQMTLEKEEAITKAKNEAAFIEDTYLQRLEVESQKLNDAENQISNYEEYLRQVSANFEEIKHEKAQLESELHLKKDVIKSMMLEHELELDSLRNQMRQEIQERDDEICRISQNFIEKQSEVEKLHLQNNNLEADIKQRLEEKSITSSLLEQKEVVMCERLKELNQLKEEIKRLQDCKDASFTSEQIDKDEKICSLTVELEQTKQELSQLKIEFVNFKEHELKTLEEKHRDEMESLRSRFKLAVSTTTVEKLPTVRSVENLESEALISSEDLEKILAETREEWEKEKERVLKAVVEEEEKKLKEAVTEAVNNECLKHKVERNKMISNLRKEYEENLKKLKSRFTAENQVSFNEAINSLAKEKDTVIEDLRSKISALEVKHLAIRSLFEKYSSLSDRFPKTGEAVLSQSDSGSSASSYKVLPNVGEDQDLAKLIKEIEPYIQLTDTQELPLVHHNLDEFELLRKKLRMKEEEYERLMVTFMKVSQSSGSSGPCIDCTYKIAVLTCDVGDLILICYEERSENFSVFHYGQFLHFLHADSLPSLGLKIPPGPTTERFAIGMVTSKEFCVTRKPNNRYKVSLGTKFYRVKVKPWNKEKARQDYLLHRSRQMGSAVYSSRTLDLQSSPSDDGDGAKGCSHMSSSAI